MIHGTALRTAAHPGLLGLHMKQHQHSPSSLATRNAPVYFHLPPVRVDMEREAYMPLLFENRDYILLRFADAMMSLPVSAELLAFFSCASWAAPSFIRLEELRPSLESEISVCVCVSTSMEHGLRTDNVENDQGRRREEVLDRTVDLEKELGCDSGKQSRIQF